VEENDLPKLPAYLYIREFGFASRPMDCWPKQIDETCYAERCQVYEERQLDDSSEQ
jgi:hypothetical protein